MLVIVISKIYVDNGAKEITGSYVALLWKQWFALERFRIQYNFLGL
jgi:hypothetical protein